VEIKVNKELMVREWVINRWYEKVVYVIGVIWLACMAIGVVVGFIVGLVSS